MINKVFRLKVREAVLEKRELYSGSDRSFAQSLGLDPAQYSRLKKGETERLISDSIWVEIADKYGLKPDTGAREWNIARTYVYKQIESMVINCRDFHQSKLLVDDAGIGKSEALRTISRTHKNVFYVDCSQAQTKIELLQAIAKSVGVHPGGTVRSLGGAIKFQMKVIRKPIICLDEYGDVGKSGLLLTKELWNATEGRCGWFMAGANGLENMIQSGRDKNKVGFEEIYSRFGGRYIRTEPLNPDDNRSFWKDLFTDVAAVNLREENKHLLNDLVATCMKKEVGYRKDIRTMKEMIILNNY